MPFSREDKHLIKLLRQEKHYSARYFLKKFPNIKHPARKGVQNTHHWSRRPQTSHQNSVGQARSRCHCCMRQWRRRLSACVKVVVVISSTAFNSDIWTVVGCVSMCVCLLLFYMGLELMPEIKALIDWLIFQSDFLAVVSYDVVRFNTWRSFNSQSKVVTLIRCGGLLLY